MTKSVLPTAYSTVLKRSALASVATLAVVLIYINVFPPNHAVAPLHSRAQASPAQECTYSDKSFCSVEARFRGYILTKDYSDLLEQQTPNLLTCTQTSPPAACAGATNLQIQVFEVVMNAKPAWLNRNDYISTMRSYTSKYGPCPFSTITTASGGLAMDFTCSRPLALMFVSDGRGSWRFVSPSIQTE
jgi:hypothetical protein